MKTLGFPQIKEGIGSTHRGILGTYTTSSIVNTHARKQSMVGQAEDTIYQRHYVSEDRLTGLLNMKDIVG